MASFHGLPLSLATGGPPTQTPAPTASHQRLASPPAAMAASSGSVQAGELTAEEGALIISGMKFSSSPPISLPIVGMPWLKSVDLKTVGLGLLDLPYVGGRNIVELDLSRTRVEPGPDHGCGTKPSGGIGYIEYIPELEQDFHEAVEPVLEQITPYSPLIQPETLPTPTVPESPTTQKEKLPKDFPQGPRPKRFKRPAAKTVKPVSNLPKEPTRKSSRLAFKPTPKSQTQDFTPIDVQDTSTESFSSSDDPFTPAVSTHSESTKSSPIRPLPPKTTPKTSTTKTIKRKRTPSHAEAEVSTPKRANKNVAPSPKLKSFLQRSIVRGKIVNPGYFQEQGLDLFLEKLRIQGWLNIFSDTSLTCSAPDIAEFYATVSVNQGVVSAKVGGVCLTFDAQKLGTILGIPAEGCAAYVREEKAFLRQDQYLQLARKLSQQPSLSRPISVKKGAMTPMHQLMFWFVIKNVIPRGQGRNSADGMDQHFTDMLDSGVQINLPAVMIRHIHRIATNTRDHMLGYGFLLTRMMESFGVTLQKKIGVQTVDIISSTTLLGCDFILHPDQEVQTPPHPVPATSSSTSPGSMAEEVARQKTEIAEVKAALEAERAVNAKRHEDILSLFSSLLQKMNPPAP